MKSRGSGVIVFIRWGGLCAQILMFAHAEASYFDAPESSNSSESCPLPMDIENKDGVFMSAAKRTGVAWVGVVVGAAVEEVIRFNKAIFVLTNSAIDSEGFISGCVYSLSGGRFLSLRLASVDGREHVMSVGAFPSWRVSLDYYSPAILECNDQFRDACSVILK
ncbi:DUF3757 domain-containing protein [Pseudomonas lactis]|uniref:DUF3757 domain-containing protein n=1 Tax=Pseudomonas lactis TaxID=1615674 RepID=A0A7Y1LX92_9PSED|nr:DUF3757 domain-containing protein [Pseudomonas lactis]NNA71260.1 DUF3757 domain-containing protein [Pseudomonas lactis]